MNCTNEEQLQINLKVKRICRFCLSQNSGKLSSIYMRDTRIKTSAPLPIQIMAIASIEVFTNDGMPSYICTDCTQYFEYSYQFKQMCKKADNLLRQYPLTGKWPMELEKPLLPNSDKDGTTIKQQLRTQSIRTNQTNQTTQVRLQHRQSKVLLTGGGGASGGTSAQRPLLNSSPKKILNADLVPQAEPSKSVRPKMESLDDEAATIFLNKIENDDELLIDDVQRLVASEEMEEVEFVNMNSLPVVVLDPDDVNAKPTKAPIKPKLLNKDSVRILNKEADKNVEPRLSLPKVKQDEEGNVEIVAEILNTDEPYEDEPDPKDAAPVEIHIFPCPHCERSFPLRQLRDIHVRNHKRERKHKCEECNKSFFTKYDLQKHLLTHAEDKPYKCSACDKTFTRGTLLYRHERTHTDLPKFICVHCERPFLSTEDLEKHVERHTKHRPFACKLCNKAFAFKQGLERHEVVHSRQQPFPCQYCDQSFSTTSKLARHLTAHAGDRPYPCKFCAKSYLLSHHLTRHLRSHKNANVHSAIAFNCNICHETFGSRESLICHSAKHATDDSLVCPLCKECFDGLDDVTNHIKKHSDGEAYACEFCDLIFLSSEKLNDHAEADHSEEMMAYHENDKVQAEKRNTKQQQEPKRGREDVNNDDLQDSVNSLLIDEKRIKLEEPQKVKNEKLDKSPKILKQVTLTQKANVADANDGDRTPVKIRKIEYLDSSITATTTTTTTTPTAKIKAEHATPTSTNVQRKLPIRGGGRNTGIRQQSLLKGNNKVVTVHKLVNENQKNNTSEESAPSTQTSPGGVSLLQKNKMKTSPTPSTSRGTSIKTPATLTIGDSKVKVQRIAVTKSEAVALAREGRIRFEDGNIVLTKHSVLKQSKKANK